MKKWMFELNLGNILLILFCAGINLLGGWIAERFFLPIWLDSVGTFISAVMLGPVAGALSGGLMNVVADFFAPGEIWYAIVSIGGGIAVGLSFPRGRKVEPFSVIATALLAGIVMTVISTPLNMYFNGGYIGHPWGDALVDMLSQYIHVKGVCCLAGGLFVNMPDKALSIVIAMSILYFVQKRKTARDREKETSGDKQAKLSAILLLTGASLALLSVPARAADFSSEYSAYVYGRDSGLSVIEINAIMQSSDGYIWAGAYSGLYRFNGSSFERIYIDEKVNNAICLIEDGKSRMWIGTNDSGTVCYDPKTGEVTVFSLTEGLTSGSVRALCDDGRGNIYAGTAAELCRINADGTVTVFKGVPELFGVYSMTCLGNGRIAGVNSSGTLFVLDDGKVVYSGEHEGTEISYTAVCCGGDSELIVGTSDNELARFSARKDGTLRHVVTICIPELNDINRILYDTKECGYFLAASRGIAFLDHNLKTTILTRDDFGYSVSDVIRDYQGNIWFSSSKQGIMKLSYNPFMDVFCKAGLESTVVNAVLNDENKLYIGTDEGMILLDLVTWKTINNTATDFLENERVRHLMKDSKGNIWVSTYGKNGLVRISPDGSIKAFDNSDRAVLGSRFRFAVELSDGTILAASTEGLNFLSDGKVVKTMGAQDGLRLPRILCALECGNGSILVGSDGDGVYVIRNMKVIGHIGTEHGLQSLVVLRIAQCGRGYLYVTSNGLYYQGPDTANEAARRLKAFPYPNNYDAYFSDDGMVWISSSAGVYIVDAKKLAGDKEYSCVLLDHHRGFDTTLTANAWNCVQGDELYLCCSDGVRKINTKTYDGLDNNYNIVMSSLMVEDKPVELVDGVYQLPSGQGRLQLHPSVLNYALSNPLIHIHLCGMDDRGITMHQNEMTSDYYTTLSYGDYNVSVQVLDEFTGEVLKEADFALHKEAELYELTYFRIYLLTVCALLVAFLAWMIAKMSNMAIIHRQYDQIKEAKEEAELANKAKSRFLANMSHEIRTPINAVLGMDEMIMRESSEKEIREYAADIYTAGNTLLSLINDILDSSKIESGKMEIVPVEYELAWLVKDLGNMISQRAHKKDLKLEISVDETLPTAVFGDDVRVRQVITNILTNAVKYTPSGTVWFRVGGVREDNDVILHVEVEDTGIGIKEEDLPKLFEAYERIEESRNRNIEGTGLGLNITIQLLAMMGSKLEVESVYGKGSKFFFDLRQGIVDPTPIGNYAESLKADVKRYHHEGAFIAPDARVLVVDDNDMNRKVFKSLLKVTQVQISEASSGMEALELAANEHFDMVFMDHMMPEMDGVEAMHRMREIEDYDKIPILALTANAVTGARESYIEEGFDGFLPKPIVSDKLEHSLWEFLPQEMLKPFEHREGDAETAAAAAVPEDLPSVDGLDWNYAWMHLPERELLETTIREFRDVIPLQADKLDRMWRKIEDSGGDDAMSAYRIQVHGMKSAAATIGIVPLAGMAKMLEFAARDSDRGKITRLHDVFISEWRSYSEKLKGIFGNDEAENGEGREPADLDMLLAMFSMLRASLEDFDIDTADETMKKLRSYSYPPEAEQLIPLLAAAVADIDEEAANEAMEKMEEAMKSGLPA
ncbi:MAG: response regulator [Oscillospiraceae bacterium]|nr:response regulator [Oscillospiraceae bacterium]